MSLIVNVARNGSRVYSTLVTEAVEIGRRQVGEPQEPLLYQNQSGQWRLIIAELELRTVPRTLMRLDRTEQNQWRLTNLHTSAKVAFSGRKVLACGENCIVEFPSFVQLPDGISLSFARPIAPKPRIVDDGWEGSLYALGVSALSPSDDDSIEPQHTLSRFSMQAGSGSQIDVQVVLDWLGQAVAAMQRPVSSSGFFSGIAQAVAGIIDVDRAEVILWDGKQWEFDPTRRFVNPRIDESSMTAPSNAMLQQVLDTKRIVVYPNSRGASSELHSLSVRALHTAVACPILDFIDGSKEILGVLYADRSLDDALGLGRVMEAEQRLIAILATAIASSIARRKRETLVTKYQQFFSPKVTEAISLNPALLDGEDAEVTVLFCDIRGFSLTTDLIGTKAAMTWIGDTLSELSALVLNSDGVLVDYVGDEMFAMWGAPEKSPDHAFRTAMAAMNMMALRKVLSDRYKDAIPGGVDFGIGICTGPARVGNTGSKQKFKYGPMGRTVNLGSRIQGLTKHWKVSTLMDTETAKCLPADVLKRRLCKAKVVGLDGELDLFELMPDKSEPNAQLAADYGKALQLYETGDRFHAAVRAFGELVQRFPADGPSLLMLVRSVNELVEPSKSFSPVWFAKSK